MPFLLFLVCFTFFIDNAYLEVISCPEKNARYPTSQCDAYVECRDGVGQIKLCPDGLLFNIKAEHLAYPCAYPIDVDCQGRSALQPAQPTESCPHQFGYFRTSESRADCGKFVSCVFGDAYVFNCPEGLAYNDLIYKCDWPEDVRSCDNEAFLGFRCPPGNTNNDVELHPHPTNCRKYFICLKSQARLQSCPYKQVFNDHTKQCDDISNVKRCAGYVPSKSYEDDD